MNIKWQDADKLAVYKNGQRDELGSTEFYSLVPR